MIRVFELDALLGEVVVCAQVGILDCFESANEVPWVLESRWWRISSVFPFLSSFSHLILCFSSAYYFFILYSYVCML